MEKQVYKKILNENEIKRPVLLNCFKAFISGGLICLFGEFLRFIFKDLIDLDNDTANSLMYIIIVGLASILTGLGLFDKIGQFAGAGTIVPICGFSNSMTSSALESKSEGIVQGIMLNMFKLAGAVIVAGVVSAFIFGFIIYFVG